MMAVTMGLLSLPLIPADDWAKGIQRIKIRFGMSKEKKG